ncbi:MAG: ABC transporter substrate-binding protein [Gammaproteobacteria bacterium]|nr:ABC transporter substrate-binding protein [Gammaproteobacteria bacterium]
MSFKRIKMVAFSLLIGILAFTVQAESPEEMIKISTESVLADIKTNQEKYKAAPSELYQFIEKTVLPNFDFPRMTNLALGRYQRKLKGDQRARMEAAFQQLLVRTYSKALLEYEDQGVTYLPSKGSVAKGDVTVRTEIDQPGGFPIPLNYSMYLVDGKWMVYDISVDNVSLVTNYRSSFSRVIKDKGIDGLIKSLQDRNKDA